ncbi:hypothetical protein [Pseudomonas fluorescens]|nr:hypothetical protein [Pseudomonas fluorescens]
MQNPLRFARLSSKRKVVLAAVTLLSIPINARADWYIIDNYKGKIGSNNVHVSLQRYEHFGSGKNINGSYYYDSRSAPIPLYGRHESSTIELCETHNERDYEINFNSGNENGVKMHFCPFKLTESEDGLRGVWKSKEKIYKALLKHNNSLNSETKQITRQEKIEIPYWGQTPTHSFIGIYQKNENGIYIDKINTINKATGEIEQTINPQSQACQFGFYMTSIYQNIENKKEASQVRFNCYSTKVDIIEDYKFDAESRKYLSIKNQ